jgi:cytochrome c peroxidase
MDKDVEFDTPTLVEIWRTAPYLYDGRVATMKEVLTTHNQGDKHGRTSDLIDNEIRDLARFVLSL